MWSPESKQGMDNAFEQQVLRQPHACAITWWSGEADTVRLTYNQLNDCAEDAAHAMREALGSGARGAADCRGDVVVLLLEPGIAWAVAQLGTLKAGAAFCNLDHAMPPSRLLSVSVVSSLWTGRRKELHRQWRSMATLSG